MQKNATSTIIAHQRSADDDIQTLETHLLEVAASCQTFAHKIGLGKQGELIGLLHDLGKYSSTFQNYIKSAVGILNSDEDEDFVNAKGLKGKIDHSTAGAQLIWQKLAGGGQWDMITAQILALCVASHHSGLIDCLNLAAKDSDLDSFTKRIEKPDDRTFLREACSKMDKSIELRFLKLAVPGEISLGIKGFFRKILAHDAHEQIIQFKMGLLVRCLFSCLIDADRISSADFEKPQAAKNRRHGQYGAWQDLITLLDTHLSSFKIKTTINSIRATIAHDCKTKAVGPRGMYTLSVPTGGGKTLASLRFALYHVAQHQMDRIIYAIPFTSIIDQNADVVRRILEPLGVTPGSIVFEDHSNLMPEKQNWKSKMLSENWDAPIIYTTNVQLLETLFGAGTRGVRRLHQLANSVIIFDEIQTLPINCIHLFSNAINFLVEQCGATVVLCTATQPSINLVEESKGALHIPPEREIMPNVEELFVSLNRVNVLNKRRAGGWTNAEVATLAIEETMVAGSCLVIVNTKKTAQALFKLCDSQAAFPVYHLSTNMCPAHRRAVLEIVRRHLANDEPLLCISTQLIEAGVDVDFGTVIRSIAGLDSIAQAAGRCNRNSRRPIGSVYIVNLNEERTDMLLDIACGQKVTEQLLDEFEREPERFGRDLIGPKSIAWFFQYYFAQRRGEMDYPLTTEGAASADTLLNLLSTNPIATNKHERIFSRSPKHYLRQSFMIAAKAFKSIDAPTRGVIVPYGAEGADLINELKSTYLVEKQFELLQRAQQFTVNVFPGDLRKLLDCGALREIQKDIEILYLDALYYDDNFGLGLTAKPMGVYCV